MKKIGKWLPSTILAFTCIYGLGINCASGADYVWTGGAGADTNLRNGANWEGGVSPTTIEYTTLTALSGHNVVIPAGMIATDTGILTKNMTLTLNGTLSLGEPTDVSSQFRGIWMNGKSNIV
ncbi:MAG: hypothetical protein Q4C70_09230 [Planctomycetia bacterium]|nr:hypothetical protein [Planctomycetia bacterium]